MGNIKIFSGVKKLLSIKLGTLDGKMYLGENLLYPIPIGSAVVTCGSKTYNGSEQVASDISVTLNGETLVNGVDYTVIANTGGTNAGSYTVTISGTNYFNGSASGTFTITKANGSVTTEPTATNPTYNGSAQALVTAGAGTGTMLYKLDSGEWGSSIPTATNASTAYTVYYKASESDNYTESTSGSVSCSINKVTPTVTAPVARALSYNGTAQQLADAGSTDFGTLQYSLDNSTWDVTVPSGTAVGDYTVYYRVVGDSNINDVAAQSITCTIGKQVPSYTAPTAKTGLTYDGSAQVLLNAGSTSDGVIEYSSDNVNWDAIIPSGTNAGDYTSYWRLIGDDDHSDIPSTSIITTIAKGEGSVISAPTPKTLTYNGSTQELINAGSGTGTMLYKLDSGEWGDAIPTATNASTAYTVYYKAAETDNYTESASGSVVSSIAKVTPTVTSPTPKELNYNGSPQALINAGSTDYGTLQYSLDNSTWDTAIPSGTAVGSYTVYYRVLGDDNINDVAAHSVTSTIDKILPVYTAPTAKTGLTYDGSAQALLNAGSTSDGVIEYSSDNVNWDSTIPSGTNAGNHTSYWRLVGDETHSDIGSTSIVTTIAKATGSVTSAPTAKSLTYNGSAQELINAGSGTGTMYYKSGSDEWTTVIPNGTNAGNYTVYYKAAESDNYTESASGSVPCSISKVTPTVVAPTPKVLTYNGSSQTLADDGSTNYGTIQYSLSSGGTYSASVPSQTNANITYYVWYKVVGDSNVNDVAPASVECTIAEKRVTTPTITLSPTGYTYNGSACQPTPTVKDGSTIIPSSEYNVSYSNNVNAGTATVVISDKDAGNYYISGTTTFNIAKAPGSVDVLPTPNSLTYNGTAQTLISAGSGTGTMLYKLDSGEWSSSIPTATNADSYTVYYKASETDNYSESTSGSVSCSINKVTPTVTAPTAKSLTYNGSAQQLANEGSTNWGTLQYSSDNSTWGTSVPSGTSAGDYTVYYRVVGNSNINDVASNSIACSISKADTSYTAPTAKTGLTYNGSSQALLNDGSVIGGTLQYSSDNSTWGTSVPSGVDANTYTSYWRIVGDANHKDKTSVSISTTISPKTVSSPTITLSQDSYTYSNSACQPTPTVKDGSTTISSSEYTVSYSNNVNVGTATCTINDKSGGNYTVSGSKTFTINCYSATGPTGKSLTYNGANQALINGGSTAYGTMVYSLSSTGTFSSTIPSGSTAGDYYIYWKVTGNTNVCNTSADYVHTSIAKAGGSVTTAPTNSNPTYGTSDNLCSAGSGTGTMYYKLGSSGTYSTSIPTANGLNAGSYTVYYYAAASTNYNASSEGSITVTVAKAAGSVAIDGVSLTYNGSSRYLASVSNNTGTMHYSTNYSSWSTSIPTATDVGSWTIYWYMDESTNYTGIGSSTSRYVSSSIDKADQSAPTAYGDSVTYGNTATATASGGGGVGSIEWSNGSTLTGNVNSKTTKARWTGNGNYNASPWSNEVTLSITRADGTATVNGVTLSYNGSSRNLVSVSSNTGTMHYKVGSSGSWSTTMPTSTNAGSWTIYWYMDASTNYNGIASSSTRYVSSTIAKINPTISATPGKTTYTYNGYAQNLLSGGTANVAGSFSYNTGTNAGTYNGTWTFTPNDTTNYNTVGGTVTGCSIAKAGGSAYATANGWTYDGNAHAVVYSTGGYGTLQYRLEGGSLSTSIPTATNAGTYKCQVYSPGDGNHNEAYSGWYTCTVSKANQSAPTAYGSTTTYPTNATASASGGGGVGSLEWESAQSQTSVGSHTTRARWSGNDNYNPSPYSSYVTVQMNKAPGSVTINGVSLTYNGSSRNLATVSGPTGTMHYSTDYSNWSTSIPTSTNTGSWYVYWYMDASTNYEGIGASSSRYVSSSIGKANQSAPTAYGDTTTYSTTATATASGGGGQGSIEWSNGNTQTSVGSKTTKARWSGNGNYNASDWSNEVTLTMNKANQSAPTATGATVCYGNTATATASGGGGAGTLTWTNGNTRTAVGSQTTAAYWAGNSNYNASSNSNSVTLQVTATWCSGTTWLGTLTWPSA